MTVNKIISTDQNFGKLKVLVQIPNKTMKGSPLWLCKCECRNYIAVSESALLSSKRKSCGCNGERRPRIFISADKKLGKLTLISYTGKFDVNGNPLFLYFCECKKTIDVPLKRILRKPPQSCGCHRREYNRKQELDITGKIFGKLKAIRKTEKKTENNTNIWLCECKCGNYLEVPVSNLINGHTKSCGCHKREYLTPDSPISKIQNGTNLAVLLRKEPNKLNTSGVTGVYYLKGSGKWKAVLQFQNKIVLNRKFDTFADAVKARKKAEQKYFVPVLDNYGKNK
jgi:hypothetical protein